MLYAFNLLKTTVLKNTTLVKYSCLSIAFIISFNGVYGQIGIKKISLWDSLRIYTNNKNGGFRLGFDNRNSYIGGKSAAVQGLRFGLNYNKVALYAGVYTSISYNRNANDTQITGFDYFGTTLEYYLADKWRYDIYVPISFGYGQKYSTTYNPVTLKYNHKINLLLPIEVGIGGTVRFLRYLGIAATTGYRFSLLNNTDYASPYWSIGITFYTGTMWRDAKIKYKKITKK